MTLRHCLDCDALVINASRCRRCDRIRGRKASTLGRVKRGSNWSTVSRRIRDSWRVQGIGCALSHLGNCRGRIQADHHEIPGVIQPLCAYHNNMKH